MPKTAAGEKFSEQISRKVTYCSMTIAATDQLHLSIVRYITLIVITIQVIKKNIAISSSGSITCKLYMFSKTLKVELMTWNVDQNIEQREVKKLKK